MLRGLYAAASAMAAQLSRQDVYANNLANVNSVGFRRGRVSLGQFANDLRAALEAPGEANGGVAASGAALDLGQGPLIATQNPLDLAITGDAFFAVQTRNGVAYTRDGRFQLDPQGRLVTRQGDPVLGEQGPITLPAGEFTVAANGEVTCQGTTAGKLLLVVPAQPQALGGGLYSAPNATASPTSFVTQGMVEQANVNGIREMGMMLSGYRLYEANAAALRQQDETLSSLVKIV